MYLFCDRAKEGNEKILAPQDTLSPAVSGRWAAPLSSTRTAERRLGDPPATFFAG